jgi:hypothetical protein
VVWKAEIRNKHEILVGSLYKYPGKSERDMRITLKEALGKSIVIMVTDPGFRPMADLQDY